MRRSLQILWVSIALVASAAAADPVVDTGTAPVVRFVEFETNVNPVTAHRIVRAIDDAEAEGNELVLIRLDTPGGLLQSMETIVKRMLDSEVPVAVWIGPAGAHGASAGFFILMAADVAAMAPGTRTGAAATIFGDGEGSEDNVLLKKVNEDTAALLRSIAKRRGRNVEASESTVFAAKAFEETVALEEGLIDLIAGDPEELLEMLDGREVLRFDGTTTVLHTAGATLVTSEFSFKQTFMETLAIPLVAYLLFSAAMLGLYVEFTHPGAVFPGVVGALCLLLFAISAQVLPVSSIGVLLILLAGVMFILEIKVVSFGMLTLGGIVCLLVGSLMLIDGPIPELQVPWTVVVPTTIVVGALCAAVMRLAIRAQRERVGTGVEGLVGEIGTVTRKLDPVGKILVHGEIWHAAATGGEIPVGARVQVVSVNQMTLTVGPADGPES